MIKGLDLSHHNKNMKDLRDICNYDFIIMKASEGMGFRDRAVSLYMDVLKDTDIPIGFYHFARPEINSDPIVEAMNFVNAVRPYLSYNPILALDVEARALTVPLLDPWCLTWCNFVYKNTGRKPLIYCSEAEVGRFKLCCDFGCGLWIAKWSKNKPTDKKIKPWKFWAIWQNSNNCVCSGVRVDHNYFNGTKDQLRKYGEVLTDGQTDDKSSDNSGDRKLI